MQLPPFQQIPTATWTCWLAQLTKHLSPYLNYSKAGILAEEYAQLQIVSVELSFPHKEASMLSMQYIQTIV